MREATSLFIPFMWLNKYMNGLTCFTNRDDLSYRDSKNTLHDVTLGTISSTYNIGCTSRSRHNKYITQGGKHIFDGGTTTYNDNTHHTIFQSYKYINRPIDSSIELTWELNLTPLLLIDFAMHMIPFFYEPTFHVDGIHKCSLWRTKIFPSSCCFTTMP